MTYGFGRSTYRSARGRVSSFRGRGRGANSDSYHSRESFPTESGFRGQSSSYRGRNDHSDFRGKGTHYSGERDSDPTQSRRDDESSFHRRGTREAASGSYGRQHSHSRRSDGEADRKRMKIDVAGSFKEGYSPRRSYDEQDHPRSLNNSSSSTYRSHSGSFGVESYKKNFDEFKKPLPPTNRPTYSNRRPTRSTRGRVSISGHSTSSLSRRNPTSRFKPTSRLQLTLRNEKKLQIERMRKERETRGLPSSGKPYTENKRSSSKEKQHVSEDVDMAETPRPLVMSSSQSESGTSPQKPGWSSESPTYRKQTYSSFRRIALKCPHCKLECQVFRTYQAHLSTHRHKAAMEKLLYNLKQKLSRLRIEQREAQRMIDERDDNFNRTLYCKACKLNYKQTKQEHVTSDFHISMIEFLNSKCKICRMDFATPLLYEHHRCTLYHIKRKDSLERSGELKVRNGEEDGDDDNFMVLDSVGSADESNEDVDSSNEDTESPKRISLEIKKKTTIIGKECIEKVDVYYCKICKLCLHYNPNRDAEADLSSHCRSRCHVKRFCMERAKQYQLEKKTSNKNQSARKKSTSNSSVEAVCGDEANEEFAIDDETTGDGYKSSGDEDGSQAANTSKYDRFTVSDDDDVTDWTIVEPEDSNQPKDTDISQGVVKSVAE